MKRFLLLVTLLITTAIAVSARTLKWTENAQDCSIKFSIEIPTGELDFDFEEGGGQLGHDVYGRLNRVSGITISYDIYGRVCQVGDVTISYDIYGRLNQVGGASILYDIYGNFSSIQGRVKTPKRTPNYFYPFQ